MTNGDITHFIRQSLKGHTQNYNVLITGSMSDLSLQDYLEHPSDIDILSWHTDIHISPQDSPIPGQFTGQFYRLETCNSPAGFAKIIAYESSGEWTYCGKQNRLAEPNHGPAFTQVRLDHHHKLTSDLVIGLRYSVWPSNATEWKERSRLNGWPSNEIVRKIINDGCHLVMKPHPSHPDDENEWRFSFSLAESTLARELNDVQRYIYRIFRRIKSNIVKEAGGSDQTILKTYHLKTLLFWAYEEKPSSFWEEGRIETTVEELLAQMIEWLIEERCPNYFIPSCNLFDCQSMAPDREIELLTSYAEDLKLDLPKQMSYKSSFQFPFPRKFVLFWQMIFNCINFVNPRKPKEVMSSLNRLARNPLLIEEIQWIYKAISIHLNIYSGSGEVKSAAVEKVKRCFSFAKNKDMESDHCPITIQLSDNVYGFITNLGFIKSATDSNDQNQESESAPQFLYEHGFVLDFLTITDVLNHQFIRPSYFFRAAYEANFYYTVLHDYQSVKQICDEALEVFHTQRDNQVLHLGAEWIDFCKDRFSVVITNKWIQLFDEAIVVTTGFLVLCDAVKATIGKLQTPLATIIDQRELGCLIKPRDKFYIRIDPIDFLRYIRRQCSMLIDEPRTSFAIDSIDFLKVCLTVGYMMNAPRHASEMITQNRDYDE